MRLLIGKRSFPVVSLADASARYQRFRGTKSSDVVPEGLVKDDAGQLVAKVSYNGRVWSPGPWHAGMAPLLEAVEVAGA